MDLSSILSKSKKKDEGREIFWSIVIEDDWVQAGVWEIVDGAAKLISEGSAVAWKEDSELVDSTDTALSGAVSGLDDEAPDPVRVVFGVGSSWVEEGQIKEEKLSHLKRVCEKLSLKPAGFVVLPEAIAHLTKAQEGSPLSAVIIGVGAENLEISVFHLGKLKGTKIVARSVSVSDDILEGLARFASTDPLPSRFVLYDGKEGELEEIKQGVIETDWQSKEKVKFLHTPKIEIFKPKDKVLATALAGAAEIANVSAVSGEEDNKHEEETKEREPSEEELSNVSEPDEGEVTADDVGFVVGEDVSQKPSFVKNKIKSAFKQTPLPEKEGSNPKALVPRIKGIFDKLMMKLEEFGRKGPKVVSSDKPGKKKALMIVGGVLVLLGLISWWFLPRATVTIFVSPKKLDQDISFSAGPSVGNFDLDKKQIPGEFVSVTESGEKTKSTTGTKTIGDRAQGTVQVRNGTDDSVQLAVGTIITSGNDLNFELTESASVSAALSPQDPGTANVKVQAADIGSEYNLAKDETFKVKGYGRAEVDAIATGDFTGGSSRQISAVSQDDLDSLLEDLESELKDKSVSELSSKIDSDKVLVEESIELEAISTDYSADVGEEADNTKLSLEVKVKAIVVSRNDLFELSKGVLEKETPDGYVLRENQLEFSFDTVSIEDDLGTFDGSVTANLLPSIDTADIAGKISGKTVKIAETFLSTIPGYQRAQIILKPSLPGLFKTLPHVVGRISVEVAAEK